MTLALIVYGLGTAIPAGAAAGAPAAAAPFVYVANHGSNDVSQFAAPRSISGALQPLTPATVATGSYPDAVAVTPDGSSTYVANANDDTVSQYSIDPATGKLAPKSPATVPTGRAPIAMTVSPDGTSAYAANASGNTVSQYTINPATGKLTPMSPATVPAGREPAAIAVTPDGTSAYVVNDNGNTIGQYSIGPGTGKLTPKSPAAVPAGRAPIAIAVSPDGTSAYVTEPIEGTVLQYSIGPMTGQLTPKSPATVPAGHGATAVAVTPNGKSAYVVNACGARPCRRRGGEGTVSQYRIDPVTGTLSPMSPATVPAGHLVQAVVIAPDGKSAYVPSETLNKVWQYSIDPATGKLTPKSPAAVPAGTGSEALAVTPDADGSVKVTAPASAATGSDLTYTIKITDAGPSAAWRVTLTDRLPYATRFLKASATGGRCSGGRAGTPGATVTCHLSTINSGSSRTARIQVKITSTSSQRVITDAAKTSSVTPDPRRSNNTATAHTKITK